MRLPLIPAPVNHVLRANSWALERLRPHAGQVICVDHSPFSIRAKVTTSGEVADAERDAVADVTLRVSPGVMLRLMARDASVWNDIQVDGNPELAATLNHIARNLRWDVEEDLSRVFGDIAAHRMAETGRKIASWGQQGADNLARSLAEYWTEERPLVANRAAVEQFNREVDALRDDVARLDKRIEQFAASRQ